MLYKYIILLFLKNISFWTFCVLQAFSILFFLSCLKLSFVLKSKHGTGATLCFDYKTLGSVSKADKNLFEIECLLQGSKLQQQQRITFPIFQQGGGGNDSSNGKMIIVMQCYNVFAWRCFLV